MAVRFRLFRFPVQIQPGFWLLTLLLGLNGKGSIETLLAWVGVVLISVLAHELGHAFAARAYGQEPVIVLHMLGGVTSWRPSSDIGRRRRIWVTLAGPTAGLALGLAALLALFAVTGAASGAELPNTPLAHGLELLAGVNVFWSLVNLLPVLPFDGGQVLAQALGPARKRLTASVSLLFGVTAALAMYRLGAPLGALLFAMAGVSSFLSAVARPATSITPELAERLADEARRALDAGQTARAAALASAAVGGAGGVETRKRALETFAWAALGRADVAAARDAIRQSSVPLDVYLQAAVADAEGDGPGALELLRRAYDSGDRRVELVALLVRLLLQGRRIAEAAELALQIADQVSDGELWRLVAEAERAGELGWAERVRAKLAERCEPT